MTERLRRSAKLGESRTKDRVSPSVLQIVTKMYFREGIPLYPTDHRAVLYSNRNFLRGDLVHLPVGELAPSTEHEPVSVVTLSVTEYLEAEYLDGEKSSHVATAGTDLIDDLADVLSFGLNAIFTRNRDLAKRLVPTSVDNARPAAGSMHFRSTSIPPATFRKKSSTS